MLNKDRLIRLRYALDIKNEDMVKIFSLGGIQIPKEEVLRLLSKQKETNEDDNREDEADEEKEELDNFMLESFLNGFIIFKRGKKEGVNHEEETPPISLKKNKSVNNVLLKKLKVALSLSSEEMLEIFNKAGVTVTKGELGALLRKEGHKHYRECGDRYARNFLKGLAIKYRS